MIANQKIKNFLNTVISDQRVAHAYLFVGPKGAGKGQLARWFFGQLTGLGEDELGRSPDFCAIASEEAINIEMIRELRERLGFSAILGQWKMALILNAERLTPEAASALLKTLEEPKANVCVILTAQHLTAILPTIISRCQIIRFPLVLGQDSEREEDVRCLEHLMNLKVGERVLESKNLVDNQSLDEMFDSWIFFLHNEMHIYYNRKDVVERLLKAKERLRLNVNKQLIVEDILINL